MPKYKVIYHPADGPVFEDDNYGQFYDSYSEADNAGLYDISCRETGAEILSWSDPDEFPYEEGISEHDTYDFMSSPVFLVMYSLMLLPSAIWHWPKRCHPSSM